jgi:hypothetical protein
LDSDNAHKKRPVKYDRPLFIPNKKQKGPSPKYFIDGDEEASMGFPSAQHNRLRQDRDASGKAHCCDREKPQNSGINFLTRYCDLMRFA